MLGLFYDHHRNRDHEQHRCCRAVGLRGHQADRDAAEIRILQTTIEWAVLHEVEPDQDHANHGFFGDRPIPLAGDGAPLVSEFAAMEYAAARGMSTDAGNSYLGRALELRYRLPRLWARVSLVTLPVWRAGRIADHAMSLPMAGAAHVDRHLAPVGALVFVGAAGTPGRGSDGAVRPRSRRGQAT